MPKTALLEEKSSTSTSYWVRRALPAISHAKTTNNSARVSGETIGLSSGREEYDQQENNDVAQQYRLCADDIGRAHVRTPVTNASLVCRLLLETKSQATSS